MELHLFEVHLEVTEHFYGHRLPTSYSTYAIDVKNAIGTICGLPLYVDPFALHRRLQRSNCLSTAIPPLLFPAKGTTLYVLGTSTVLIGLGRSRLNIEAAPPTATTSSAAESAASPSAEPPIYAAPRRRHTRRHRRHVGRRVDAAVAAAPTTPFRRRRRRHALPTAHSTVHGTVRPADTAHRRERQRGHSRDKQRRLTYRLLRRVNVQQIDAAGAFDRRRREIIRWDVHVRVVVSGEALEGLQQR